MEKVVLMLLVFAILEAIVYYSWKFADFLIVKKYKKKESEIQDVSHVELYDSKWISREINERKWTKVIFSVISLFMVIVSWKLSFEIFSQTEFVNILAKFFG